MAEPLPGEQPSEILVKGYLTRFCLEKRVSEYRKVHFDLEVGLAKEYEGSQPESVIRFLGVQDLCFGDSIEKVSLGAHFQIWIESIIDLGWEGLSYRVTDLEMYPSFSLYCRAFELERKV